MLAKHSILFDNKLQNQSSDTGYNRMALKSGLMRILLNMAQVCKSSSEKYFEIS